MFFDFIQGVLSQFLKTGIFIEAYLEPNKYLLYFSSSMVKTVGWLGG